VNIAFAYRGKKAARMALRKLLSEDIKGAKKKAKAAGNQSEESKAAAEAKRKQTSDKMRATKLRKKAEAEERSRRLAELETLVKRQDESVRGTLVAPTIAPVSVPAEINNSDGIRANSMDVPSDCTPQSITPVIPNIQVPEEIVPASSPAIVTGDAPLIFVVPKQRKISVDKATVKTKKGGDHTFTPGVLSANTHDKHFTKGEEKILRQMSNMSDTELSVGYRPLNISMDTLVPLGSLVLLKVFH